MCTRRFWTISIYYFPLVNRYVNGTVSHVGLFVRLSHKTISTVYHGQSGRVKKKKKRRWDQRSFILYTKQVCEYITCATSRGACSLGPDVPHIHLRAMCPAVGFAGRPARFLLRPKIIRQVHPYRHPGAKDGSRGTSSPFENTYTV